MASSIPSLSPISSSSSSSYHPKLQYFSRPFLCLKFKISFSTHKSSSSSQSPFPHFSNNNFKFQAYSAVDEITVEEAQENQETESTEENKKKLYVVNIPWTFSVEDMKNLFGECGNITDIEIIKHKNGKNRGFAFITMASEEEARAVVDKFDSYDISGRIIRIEFAKRLKKPSPASPTIAPTKETQYKLYVSNLAWKARSTHLRELFSTCSSPVSTRVVFDRPAGRSAGYGFISFATKEEAETALSALDGKELMGRPIRLKFSEKNVDEYGSEPEKESAEEQAEETGIDTPSLLKQN